MGLRGERSAMASNRKLTAETIDRLAAAIGDGLPDKYAAQLCGLSPSTVKSWRAAGKTATPQSLLARLDKRLAQADAEFIKHHVAKIAEAKPGAWQSSAWLLERKFQTDFALVQRTEIGQPGDFAKLTADEVKAKILALVKAPRAGEVKV